MTVDQVLERIEFFASQYREGLLSFDDYVDRLELVIYQYRIAESLKASE
jgi:hypothetical protein